MIVVETFLKRLFSQLPDVQTLNGVLPVKYHWGSQDDLNLYMQLEKANKTPLIWLVQDKGRQHSSELTRRVKLIIAINSTHKTDRNPVVWEKEFETVLDPLFANVIQCFKASGMTTIVNQDYDVYREANYSYEQAGESNTKAKTTYIWNVITFEANILFSGTSAQCIQKIKFNT